MHEVVAERANVIETGKFGEFTIQKEKGNNDNLITVKSLRITGFSTKQIEETKNYAGILMYSKGTLFGKEIIW